MRIASDSYTEISTALNYRCPGAQLQGKLLDANREFFTILDATGNEIRIDTAALVFSNMDFGQIKRLGFKDSSSCIVKALTVSNWYQGQQLNSNRQNIAISDPTKQSSLERSFTQRIHLSRDTNPVNPLKKRSATMKADSIRSRVIIALLIASGIGAVAIAVWYIVYRIIKKTAR